MTDSATAGLPRPSAPPGETGAAPVAVDGRWKRKTDKMTLVMLLASALLQGGFVWAWKVTSDSREESLREERKMRAEQHTELNATLSGLRGDVQYMSAATATQTAEIARVAGARGCAPCPKCPPCPDCRCQPCPDPPRPASTLKSSPSSIRRDATR